MHWVIKQLFHTFFGQRGQPDALLPLAFGQQYIWSSLGGWCFTTQPMIRELKYFWLSKCLFLLLRLMAGFWWIVDRAHILNCCPIMWRTEQNKRKQHLSTLTRKAPASHPVNYVIILGCFSTILSVLLYNLFLCIGANRIWLRNCTNTACIVATVLHRETVTKS